MPEYTKQIISNLSVGHCAIGTTIDDYDNENSQEAIQARRYFDHCALFLFENFAWPFATQRFILSTLTHDATTTPKGDFTQDWAYRYKYPANCVRVDRIVNTAVRTPSRQSEKIPFKIADRKDAEGKVILTDEIDAIAEGNHSDFIDDVDRWPASFVEAFTLYHAFRMSPALTVDNAVKRDLFEQWRAWQASAVLQAWEESQSDENPPSEYQTVRS